MKNTNGKTRVNDAIINLNSKLNNIDSPFLERGIMEDAIIETSIEEVQVKQEEVTRVIETAEKAETDRNLYKQVEDLTKMVEALVKAKAKAEAEAEELKAQVKQKLSLDEIKTILERKEKIIQILKQFSTVRDTLENIHIENKDVDLDNTHYQLVLNKFDHNKQKMDPLFSITKNYVIMSAIENIITKIDLRIIDLNEDIKSTEKLY